MFNFSILEICIGLAGLLLIINGILALLSEKYYKLFAGVFFIESFSEIERVQLKERLRNEHEKSRYFVAFFTIFFGVTSLLWALGYKTALGWPFTSL